MGKQGVDCPLTVVIEFIKFIGGIAFCHDGKVNAAGDVSHAVGSPDISPGDAVLRRVNPMYEYIVRVDGMCQFPHFLIMKVSQCDRHVNRVFGEGHVIAGLKSLAHTRCLLSALPFLEQCGEGMYVK